MISRPYISVVVPTTRIGGLDVTLSSLETQTLSFECFELIIVDALYNYRKYLIAQKSKEYSFRIKHVAQPKSCATFAQALNIGAINADGVLIYFLPDFTWVKSNCLQIHTDFHKNKTENYGLIGHFWDCSLPKLHKDFYRRYANDEVFYREKPNNFLKCEREDYDNYMSDLDSGKLNNMMFSIFETPFDKNVNHNAFKISVQKQIDAAGAVGSRKCIFKNEID
jgi:hypothetical protein